MNKAYLESARRIGLAMLVALALGIVGVLGWFSLFEPPPKLIEVARRVRGPADFDFNLFLRLSETRGRESFVYSPLALRSALLMLKLAAREETSRQIERALRTGPTDEQVRDLLRSLPDLQVANRLWLQQEFDPSSTALSEQNQVFGVMPALLDFHRDPKGAREKINRWTSEHTGGVIDGLLPQGSIDALTQFLLTSGARFSSPWEKQFPAEQTEPGEFTRESLVKTTMTFMRVEDTFPYYEDRDLRALELPYEDGELAMLVLLPRRPEGIEALRAELSRDKVGRIVAGLKARRALVQLPKAVVGNTISLPMLLVAMGMSDAFDPGRADFGALTGRRDLYLSSVIHRAQIKIDESGGRAAESAGRLISAGGGGVSFRVNHPFIFLIRHLKTNTIVFIGQIAG